ncbi:hypothetical protein P3X46_006708 [Hevea brasiliensis]|uniref:RING-type E3 ubiquitin transferase n=1 Tax=Hevea brasiliensis TaxID=3981 RepID=A0ABQ9MTP0_HEVBR|nr:E3 ubiquitin-protein ligase ATL9-like [Hevea brasiliensis]KAJ9182750.1 hypothetical protein P3X46_006708 [Hevea brasiliensis]
MILVGIPGYHRLLSHPLNVQPLPSFSLQNEGTYTYSTEPSTHSSSNIITWWWIPMLVAVTVLFFLIFLQCYIWFKNLRGRVRVIDIELAITWNEDDHSVPAATAAAAAAPTKPWLTAEALEEAFPTFAHGKIVKSDECAICLEEFKEGEKCRMLVPSCVHIFHKDCIDTWLSEDTRCPLCRAVLFS